MDKPPSPPGDKRLWGACFRSPPDPALMRLSRAESSHFLLAPYDIEASKGHARELERAGILCVANSYSTGDPDPDIGTLAGTKILAGLLPKSVVHCCARSCTLQRT